MEQYKLFLQDTIFLLKEKFELAKAQQMPDDSFQKGISFGLYDALDLIKSQARAFSIPLDDIGLGDYNLEEYL